MPALSARTGGGAKWWAAGIVVLAAVTWIGVGWYLSVVITASRPWALDPEVEAKALHDAGIVTDGPVRHVQIPSGKVTLAATYLTNPRSNGCAVVFLNGYAVKRPDLIPAVPVFWELGCDAVIYDHRGAGESSDTQRTFGFLEKQDTAAVIGWLAQASNVPKSRIGLWGVSFGASVALQTLEIEPALGFVVADTSFSSMRDIVEETGVREYGEWIRQFSSVAFFLAEVRTGLRVDDVAPVNSVVGVSTPILLVHSREDPATPARHSRAIFLNADPRNAALQITDWGAGHGDSVLVNFDGYRDLVHRFLRAHRPDFTNPDHVGGGRATQ